jgi:hypothetical protein
MASLADPNSSSSEEDMVLSSTLSLRPRGHLFLGSGEGPTL